MRALWLALLRVGGGRRWQRVNPALRLNIKLLDQRINNSDGSLSGSTAEVGGPTLTAVHAVTSSVLAPPDPTTSLRTHRPVPAVGSPANQEKAAVGERAGRGEGGQGGRLSVWACNGHQR